MHKMLLVGAAVVGATLPSAVPGQDLCKPLIDNIATIERTCLSNSSQAYSLSLKGSIDLLKRAIEGNAGVNADTIRGARTHLADEYQKPENDAIRDCMKKYQERLLQCLDKAIEQLSSSVPDELELQFSLTPREQRNPNLYYDRVVLGVKTPPRATPEKPMLLNGAGLFTDNIGVPREDRKFYAFITRAVREGFLIGSVPAATEICLQRAKDPPQAGNPLTRLECFEGQPCTKFHPLDPGWLRCCESPTSVGRRTSGMGWRPALIGVAYAQEGEPEGLRWHVPSLATLEDRRAHGDVLGVGYTAFEIVSDDVGKIDADGVALDIRVNDTPVEVEGLPGKYLVQKFDPKRGLRLSFALQNLDFDGRFGGCDLITVDVKFFKDGEQVGPVYMLKRSYVPLRDAPAVEVQANTRRFSWSGKYRRPKNEWERFVFIQSTVLPSWDDVRMFDTGRDELNRLQRLFNQLKLTYEGRPLVAIVRPPLTRPSYGLAIGIVQSTRQVQFSFPKDAALRLRSYILDLRNRRADVRKVVGTDAFVYPVNKDVPPPAVCGHLGV